MDDWFKYLSGSTLNKVKFVGPNVSLDGCATFEAIAEHKGHKYIYRGDDRQALINAIRHDFAPRDASILTAAKLLHQLGASIYG